jgi:dCTP deaminase
VILNDVQIQSLVLTQGMIDPFVEEQVRSFDMNSLCVAPTKLVSFGLSSFGYDFRVGCDFKVFSNAHGSVVDPKAFDPKAMVDVHVGMFEALTLPAHGFALGTTLETVRMPRDVMAICLGKSTYARCGVVLHCTPLEPGWRGQVTIEISNTTPLPVKVYAGEGIMQVVFMRGEPCAVSYEDRGGKYQDQTGVTPAKL